MAKQEAGTAPPLCQEQGCQATGSLAPELLARHCTNPLCDNKPCPEQSQHAGVLEMVKRRPVDVLQTFLEERAPTKIDQFFGSYGAAEAAATCLLLCTAPPSPCSQVLGWRIAARLGRGVPACGVQATAWPGGGSAYSLARGCQLAGFRVMSWALVLRLLAAPSHSAGHCGCGTDLCSCAMHSWGHPSTCLAMLHCHRRHLFALLQIPPMPCQQPPCWERDALWRTLIPKLRKRPDHDMITQLAVQLAKATVPAPGHARFWLVLE